ncbi:ABC transporter ATP-binding protein [Streptomyces mexicanus]|jgi:branched-chain amino acid transport system ATP-binding protein|uniref:ATP-binding cassette domain-containing protein n=1 Tax=Streptomyces mexicanus TaxID=178566 RepID=A0A7X1HXQ0_9ACTN|nr:ATP-binding cassette domain-containing protein [Streptomyces mexicanus]MBC2864944.1 ATP-binding cassette domain-containing protein [Streptomyces mexicanus]
MSATAAQKTPATPATELAIAARGLSLGYGSLPYVTELDLEVKRGEIVAVLGANGAGKSTTIMGLAGALKPYAGHVEINGEVTTAPMRMRARQGLAVVTQERCVFMGMTVRDNLRAGGVTVEAALEYFPELEEHVGRTVGFLSGGQQQMLAAARAIARRPKILLADELSLGLAPKIVDRILEVLERACREENLGVLLVEQQVVKALSVAHRGVVLRRGRLELEGTATELKSRLDEVQALYL